MRFAESEHNASMRRYEQACREVNALDKNARKSTRQRIEDDLVEGGINAIEEYEALLGERWKAAKCLAHYDGISTGFVIAKKARERIADD